MICICGDSACTIPYGFCHCTCGGETPIAKYTSVLRRWVKDCPTLYCVGHRNTCLPRKPIEQPSNPAIRHVPLSRGMYAVVDAADYADLMKSRWHAYYDPKLGGYYATRRRRAHEPGDGERITMHGYLLPVPKGFKVDHRNRKTLNNRRKNLRKATSEENGWNQKIRKNNTTGVTGVSEYWCRGTMRGYIVRIAHKGKRIVVGRYSSLEEAAEARRLAEIKYYGDFRPE